ncbi:MAG: hydroxymethylglutaryl-CoA lyase [Chitinophagaceae bacterium]|nr:MAG: hydroxymethylglutaryl-CoA lyase [Chitinophagaceae bacterium]
MTKPGKTAQLVECPRDAMQGWPHFIPTDKKVAYINQLLKVGFDSIDFGSFVSAKAIPQMADTAEVVQQLVLDQSSSKLLAIVANTRGAENAVAFEQISYLGFPFSVSETFQQRNTNSSIEESLKTVSAIQELCSRKSKELVVYLSMGFGNPYGDLYSEEIVIGRALQLANLGVKIISVADTVGIASAGQVLSLTESLINEVQDASIGVHLHSTSANWNNKLQAALDAGCLRFDGALKGIGGCPMADDELVGNMDSELMIPYLDERSLLPNINMEALQLASRMAAELFL